MRRVATILGTAAVVMLATSVFAQAPNFAGKWTRDAEKTMAAMPAGAMPGGGGGGGRGAGGGGGGDMTIAQDAKTLTITRTTQAGETKAVYMLDGSESKNMQAGRGGGDPTEVISVAKVEGAKITITTGPTVAVYAMDGAWLAVATTRPGRGGGEATTTTTFYKKAM